MKNVKARKVVALLCAFVMLFGMFSSIVLAAPTYSNPITVNGTSYDNDKSAPEHDLTVMSFNILKYQTDPEHTFASPETRMNAALTQIKAFEPEIIGVQEASQESVNGFIWGDRLTTAMASLGYGALRLNQQAQITTSIGNGLIIYYKTDRFTAPGVSATYNGTEQGFKLFDAGSERYYQYIRLYDKTKGAYIYVYNTHLAINNNADGTAAGGNKLRTTQIKTLFADVAAKAQNMPVIMTGDYNAYYGACSTDTTSGQLGILPGLYPYMADAASTADVSITENRENVVDHIFYNDSYMHALQHRSIMESVNGRAVSDHQAIVTHFNYSGNVTFGDGTFDRAAHTFETTVDGSSYTFNIAKKNAAPGLTWTIDGGNTVSLPKAQNTFNITFKDGAGQTLNTVKATIKRTGVAKPTITATNAAGTYFANDAYQVVVNENTDKTTIRVNGGTINGTPVFDVNNIKGGRTQFTVTADNGDTYLLNLYKETKKAETGNVIYIDDDILKGAGTVAFYDGKDVILLNGNASNVFSGIQDYASAYWNTTRNYTAYVGTGTYPGNTTAFRDGLNLLGPNHDINGVANGNQCNPARREEAYVVGRIHLHPDHVNGQKYTVKGLRFDGYWGDTLDGSITITPSWEVGKLDTYEKQIAAKVDLDIQNNVFTSYGNAFNDAVILSNAAIRKSGVIAGNYFEYKGNNNTKANRAIFFRNIDGLSIENNTFKNYPDPFYLTSEIYNAASDFAGYMNVTIQNNRFEACSVNNCIAANVDETTSAHVQYLNNEFIRCGYYSNANPIVKMSFTETANIPLDYKNISFIVQGNKFLNCTRSIGIYANSTSAAGLANMTGTLKDVTVNINRNLFYHPFVVNPQANYLKYSIRLSFYVDKTKTFDATGMTNWNFKYNYFESPIYGNNSTTQIAPTTSTIAPINYINPIVTDGDNAELTGNSIADSEIIALTTPYYTDAAMTTLSSGSLPTFSVADKSTVYAYDGAAHSIADITEGTAMYSTDNVNFSSIKPTFTAIGTHRVYWKVEKAGYAPVTGSSTVTISTADRTLTFENKEVTYNGEAQALSFTADKEGDTVSYIYNEETLSEMPSFTDVGTYTVTVRVTNPLYVTKEATATLTINKAEITDVTATGYEGRYNGKARSVALTGLDQYEGLTVTYSTDNAAFVEEAPSFTLPGEYKVYIKLAGANYVEKVMEADVIIHKGLITGVTVSGYNGAPDGQAHGVTVTGLKDGMSATYTYNNNTTNASPAFTTAGNYNVTVTVSGENYITKTFVATVSLDFTPTISYFTLANGDISVSEADADGKRSFEWDTTMGATDDGNTALNGGDIEVLAYGIKLAQTSDDLLDYKAQFNKDKNALFNDATYEYEINGKVYEINGTFANGAGSALTRLFKTTTYRITKVKPMQARYAMAYIRYTVNGEIYEEYSAIVATSTLLPGVGGIGDTTDRDDILDDDDTTIGDTADRDDILDDEEVVEP